jgi:transcriptional regulator with XRE-family HTH domain
MNGEVQTSREIIGLMIKQRRKEKKLTQQQLANLLEIDRQYVWRLENGKVNLTMDYLDTIIQKLNCTHADFILISV